MSAAKGFTLVEMLVALVVASLLSVVLFAGLNLTLRTSEGVSGNQQQVEQILTAQYGLRRLLASAREEKVPNADGIRQIAFHGSESELIFISSGSEGDGGIQPYWMMISVEQSDAGAYQLLLRDMVFVVPGPQSDAPGVEDGRLDWLLLAQAMRDQGSATLLARNLPGPLQLSYLKVRNRSQQEWRSEWDLEQQLPQLIRVRFSEEESAWPEMLVLPRVISYGIRDAG